ncbi:transforming growth factor-beta receptor-associated protein, putative (macronuclear) [Tetrahymena thermophila SB210]|uniref:Transforming growth factor-beta receptor-associated protein, putative n=1 Tax=Tetrahymena thermophila (strain SB210) TaxID=312017 RepID=Q22AZ0_TETTS|nr:transforming growth factor-beta receptor-associated protein, putative [Tetrahymena thermophila SB210]EAR82468.1 transforming growth factor-beta receptor-associated protein, putative [Tetrahymena thermophila SB210]|eukprot:XP_001030131.1 transforming growth factor-beta receptor-associated protein, putative [Tetrahymena thermophila SB210]
MAQMLNKGIEDVYKFKKEIKITNFKINAMDESNNNLYLGDQNGKLYKYTIYRKSTEFLSENPTISKQLCNQKIDLIKALPFGKDLLVIANSQLFHVDGDSLQTKQQINVGSIVNLYLNEASTHKNEVLVQLKNNKLIILEFNINTGEFVSEKQPILSLSDTPLTVAFLANMIYYGTKKEYFRIDLNKKTAPDSLPSMNIAFSPQIKVTDNDELLILVTNNNTGLLIGRDCNLKPRATFEPLVRPIVQIQVQKPYLIILYENCFQIFNMQDSKKMQETEIQLGPAKRIIASQGNIIYATQQKLVMLEEIPFETRINECFKSCKIEEAMAIFSQSVTKDNPSYKDKEEAFNIDAAWNLLQVGKFREASARFENRDSMTYIRDFDIRELLALFRDLIPTDMLGKITFDNLKNIQVIIGRQQDQQVKEFMEREAYEMLVNILERMRIKYSKPQYKQFANQKMTYNISQYTLVRQEKDLELSELQKLIDFALIKVCLKRKEYSKKLCDLFRGKEPINCKYYYDEIHKALLADQIDQKDPQIIAFFYEKFDRIKDALERWKIIGSQMQSKYETPCKETIRILLEQEDSKRIIEYLPWVIKKNYDFARQFFKDVKESVMPPEQMLNLISDGIYQPNEYSLADKLAEIYLEIIITQKKVAESRFHNKLAIIYINNLFNIIPKDTKFEAARLTESGKKIYEKFKAFYTDPNSNYEPSFLLEKVQNSWLIQEEIYFCGKSKKHIEALRKLIVDLNSHSEAENYCLQNNDMTLTTMFHIYMDIYLSAKDLLLNKDKVDITKREEFTNFHQTWLNRINIFLKKYSTHPQLDTLEVLKRIPDDWVLQEFTSQSSGESFTANDGLYSFLTQTISSSLHNRRQVSCAKNLSEMDLQNVKYNLTNAKKAYVRISEEKKCAICHKSIGDKTVCVYPNAVVADQKCVSNGQSLTICPLTNQDFEKTFRG